MAKPPHPLAKQIIQLLDDAGLRNHLESEVDRGGYSIDSFKDGSVEVTWFCSDPLMDPSVPSPWPTSAQHPPVRLEYRVTTAMLMTMAELLFTSGYTVTLCPEDTEEDLARLRVRPGPSREHV